MLIEAEMKDEGKEWGQDLFHFAGTADDVKKFVLKYSIPKVI